MILRGVVIMVLNYPDENGEKVSYQSSAIAIAAKTTTKRK